MKTWTIIAFMLALATTSVSAQQRWAFEVRGGVALSTQDVGDDELGTGFGFESTLRYRLQPHLAVYGGWDWIRFAPESSFAGPDVDFEETGYAFGLRFEHPFSGEEGPIGWWVRAGGIYDHLELEDSDGDIIADSGHGFGFEAGAGVAVGTGGSWSVVPGIRYRSLSREVEAGATALDVDLRYVAVELGVAWLF